MHSFIKIIFRNNYIDKLLLRFSIEGKRTLIFINYANLTRYFDFPHVLQSCWQRHFVSIWKIMTCYNFAFMQEIDEEFIIHFSCNIYLWYEQINKHFLRVHFVSCGNISMDYSHHCYPLSVLMESESRCKLLRTFVFLFLTNIYEISLNLHSF